ncbi:MAG: hypothetical protein Q4G08_05240 [Capnocytophaga sp.]|nr:hypothetical protein [Capnocytophaga sp.]
MQRILFISFLALAACKNTPDEIIVSADAQANTERAEAEMQQYAAAEAAFHPSASGIQLPSSGGGQPNPPHGQPGHRCDIAVGAPLPGTAVTPVQYTAPTMTPQVGGSPEVGANARLNPKHGQPGHRCDIPVGEPLDGAPATPVEYTAPTMTPQVAGSVSQPAVSSSNARLNPEHGQPGHRCEIAVGAPLDSAPAIAETQATQQQISIPAQPVQPAAQTTAEGFSGKPNPEHGQPGHRCDITVGAVLP